MKAFTSLAVLASLVCSTLAHGFVAKVTIDGKVYKGPSPGSSVGNSAIRLVKNTEPNHVNPTGKNDVNADVACGRGAATRGAKVMAEAKPGSKMTFHWDAGNGDPWPHNSGPVITYAGKCVGDCSTTDATKIQWFKLAQVGKKPNQGNRWYQEDLMKAGNDQSITLPSDMPNGDYIVRHEIVALHLADQKNGAELYPSCINVRVSGGSNSGTPSATTTFPGGYKTTDPGIFINIWDTAKKAYPFPGPAIVKFTGGSGAAASTDDNSGSTDSGSTDDSGSGSGSGSSGSGSSSDDNGDDDCADDGDATSGSTGSSGTGTGSGSAATKTVTVTVTVTATPTGNSSSDYKKRDMTPLKIRRSRAHNANAIHRS